MRTRTSTLALLAAALVGLLSCSAPSTERKPNIVIILSDDQGWGDLSVHGNTNLSTPNIDSLARDGALFDRFYVSAVCSPTRAELLTGRYHARGGVYSTSTGGERLDLDEKTLGDTFKAAGTRPGPSANGTTARSIPITPTPVASTNITDSRPATGATISVRSSITTVSWFRAMDSSSTT